MPTFERSHTISLYRNPVTGKGQSNDPALSPDNGQPFTILGSGFGSKAGYSDHINTSGVYDTPINENFGVVGRWDGSNYVGASNRPVIKLEGVNGGKCLYFFQDVFGTPGRAPNNCLTISYDTPVPLGNKIFSSKWIKHNSTSTVGGQWKFERYQKSTNSLSDKPSETYYNASSAAPDNKIQIRDYRGVGSAGDATLSDSSDVTKFPHNKNSWMRVDTLITLPVSYEDRASYSHKVWVYYSDVLPPVMYDFTDVNDVDMASPYGEAGDEWNQHLFQNFFGNGDFGTSQHNLWMDKMFESVGDDKRIELTNSATWGAQTRAFIQPIESWSDTEIIIPEFDYGDMSTGWLHVIENGASIYSRVV